MRNFIKVSALTLALAAQAAPALADAGAPVTVTTTASGTASTTAITVPQTTSDKWYAGQALPDGDFTIHLADVVADAPTDPLANFPSTSTNGTHFELAADTGEVNAVLTGYTPHFAGYCPPRGNDADVKIGLGPQFAAIGERPREFEEIDGNLDLARNKDNLLLKARFNFPKPFRKR